MAKQLIDFVQEQMEDFARTLVSDVTKVTRSMDGKSAVLTMTLPVGDGMEIKMTFANDRNPYCSTIYKAHGTSFSFDRLGVEDSFYFESLDKLYKQFNQQVDRVREAQQRLAKSKRMNLGPVTLFMTQESIDAMVAKLKKGETYCYFPSGFGTGYNFTIRFRKQRFQENIKASYELESLVGQRVFISSFDAD